MSSTKFRVWWVPQIPMKAFRFPVPDIPTGVLLCEALGSYDLFQYENNIKPDYANAGGIEFLDDDGDWITLDTNDQQLRAVVRLVAELTVLDD